MDQTPDLLQKIKLVREAFNDILANYSDESAARGQLTKLLADKVCLLVLDNVLDLRHAEPFKNAIGSRCRMLITTRDGGLATALGAVEHRLDVLGDTQALKLLADLAGQEETILSAEANDVAKECGNLPLALSMCGATICSKNTWADLRDALREATNVLEADFWTRMISGESVTRIALMVGNGLRRRFGSRCLAPPSRLLQEKEVDPPKSVAGDQFAFVDERATMCGRVARERKGREGLR